MNDEIKKQIKHSEQYHINLDSDPVDGMNTKESSKNEL